MLKDLKYCGKFCGLDKMNYICIGELVCVGYLMSRANSLCDKALINN